MTTIHVGASREYDVIIECGILARSGERIADVVPSRGKAAVISDENVFPLYGNTVEASLKASCFEPFSFVFKGGEETKNLHTYASILDFLSSNRFSRSDVLISLGGGIVGDVGGFAAATYQRGISFIQLPTTLLADVDSSVGGKTAVNLASGKNQAGCFYQPSLVLCDTDALNTLPHEEYKNGCAEVIKYAILGSESLFNELIEKGVNKQYEGIISQCVSMKRDIVCIDEFDTGKRQLLNLGHTFGHAIEKCSDFSIAHGTAVAIGTAMITKAAYKKGICDEATLRSVLELLKKYDLPTETAFSAEELYAATLSDKKIARGGIHLILPKRIGECIAVSVPCNEIMSYLTDGGAK